MNFTYLGNSKPGYGLIQAGHNRAISAVAFTVTPAVPRPAFALARCGQTPHVSSDSISIGTTPLQRRFV